MSPAAQMPDQPALQEAAQRLLDGGLVAFPTETVWGLGADAENSEAIAKIYRAKGRPSDHPVIVHVAPEANLDYWAQRIPDDARRLAAAFWPGPLTLILPRANRVPAQVSGGQGSVGLRCPSHPVAQALLRTFAALKPGGQGGVAAPSANRFGRISPTRAQHVRAEFAGCPEVILVLEGGDAMVGIESTIVDLSRYAEGVGPVLLRPGDISPAQLEAVLGKPVALPDQAAPRVSGSLKAHYAPRTPLWLLPGSELVRFVEGLGQEGTAAVAVRSAVAAGVGFKPGSKVAVMALSVQRPVGLPAGLKWVAMPGDARGYAACLYATLRELDDGGFEAILLEQPPQTVEWQAVNDRVQRAAAAFL